MTFQQKMDEIDVTTDTSPPPDLKNDDVGKAEKTTSPPDPCRRQKKYFAKKWATDADFRRKRITNNTKRWTERYRTDPAFRERALARRRELKLFAKLKNIESDIKE